MKKTQKVLLTGLKFIFSLVDKSLALVSIFFVKIYQLLLSPDKSIFFQWLKGKVCCHHPHCSQYSIEVFKRYGFFIGLGKTMDRISRCGPSQKVNYDPSVHKVIFFSSAPIGVPFLQKLNENKNFDVVGVVTMPDKPIGRGQKVQPNIIKKTAKKFEIEDFDDFIQTPVSLRLDSKKYSEQSHNFKLWLESKKADRFVVIAYGKIIPTKILEIPKIMPLNIHGSILPYFRGASPIQSVFLKQKTWDQKLQTGITLIKMVKKMDAGPMLGKLIFDVPINRTSLDIIEKMQKKGPDFLVRKMLNFTKGYVNMEEQESDKVTFCKKFEKKDGEIDPWKDDLLGIYNKYRAFYLRPKIYFKLSNGKRVVIEKLEIYTNQVSSLDKGSLGSICLQKNIKKSLFLENNEINPIIKNIEFKPEGKGCMDGKCFCNGYLK